MGERLWQAEVHTKMGEKGVGKLSPETPRPREGVPIRPTHNDGAFVPKLEQTSEPR